MPNFRRLVSMSAVAILGVTNLLTPFSFANAATGYDSLTDDDLKQHALRFNMPNKDVYLYAVTEANHYFVKYNGNTHTSGTMPTGEFIYDTEGELAPNAYAKIGYTFSGWNTQANGGGTSYANKAKVWNWTTTQSGVVPIYAQWNVNRYNITYDLNDDSGTSSGSHSLTPSSLAYDETGNIANPSRVGYGFSGWDITNMDSEAHIVGGEASNATSATGVMGTQFKNLNATNGETVHFAARWKPNSNTTYKVKHYLQNLAGTGYDLDHTDDLNGTTDTEVKPSIKHYEGFTDATPYSGNIKADGSTVFVYEYPRNSYNLTLKAGRGVASVQGAGTINTTGGSTTTSKDISFKYKEPITLSFTLKPGYKSGAWSGYSDTASSFTMPAQSITKEAYATPITYNITYTYSGGTPQNDPTTYTVETATFSLNNDLNRLHSTFSGWIGGVNNEITTPTKNVPIALGSIGDRHYTAVWDCLPGYHENDKRDECVANTQTRYTVKHYKQNIEGTNYVYAEQDELYGTTDQPTNAQAKPYIGFTPQAITQTGIKGDGTTVVEVQYNRNSYNLTLNQPTESEAGAIVPTASAISKQGNSVKFEDTVTVSVVVPAGYTRVGWTGTNASGGVVEFANSGAQTTTFTMPASAVTVRPIVTRNNYTISYDLNNGALTGGKTNPTSYNVETTTFTLNEPERDNSTFVGWSGGVVDETPTTQTTVTIAKGSVGNRSYEAIWSCNTGYHAVGDSCVANQYNVVVENGDGEHGTADPVVFTYDQRQSLPSPEQSGYDFAGWDITGMSGGVEHYIGTIPVTGDTYTHHSSDAETDILNLTTEEHGTVIFTAIWTPRNDTKYTVYYYYKNVGASTYTLSGAAVIKSGTTDTPVTLATLASEGGHPSEGFTYSAGYLAGGTTRPTSGAVTTGNIEKDGSLKIYLYYDRNIHHVYLSGNNDVTLTGEGDYEYGKEVEVTATAKTGYHFVKWEKRKADRSKES